MIYKLFSKQEHVPNSKKTKLQLFVSQCIKNRGYIEFFTNDIKSNRQTSTFHERTPLDLIQGCQIRGGPICQHTMPWKAPIIPLSFHTDYDTVCLLMIIWFWFRTGVRIIIYHPRVNMSDAQYLSLNKSLRSDHTFHRFHSPIRLTK